MTAETSEESGGRLADLAREEGNLCASLSPILCSLRFIPSFCESLPWLACGFRLKCLPPLRRDLLKGHTGDVSPWLGFDHLELAYWLFHDAFSPRQIDFAAQLLRNTDPAEKGLSYRILVKRFEQKFRSFPSFYEDPRVASVIAAHLTLPLARVNGLTEMWSRMLEKLGMFQRSSDGHGWERQLSPFPFICADWIENSGMTASLRALKTMMDLLNLDESVHTRPISQTGPDETPQYTTRMFEHQGDHFLRLIHLVPRVHREAVMTALGECHKIREEKHSELTRQVAERAAGALTSLLSELQEVENCAYTLEDLLAAGAELDAKGEGLLTAIEKAAPGAAGDCEEAPLGIISLTPPLYRLHSAESGREIDELVSIAKLGSRYPRVEVPLGSENELFRCLEHNSLQGLFDLICGWTPIGGGEKWKPEDGCILGFAKLDVAGIDSIKLDALDGLGASRIPFTCVQYKHSNKPRDVLRGKLAAECISKCIQLLPFFVQGVRENRARLMIFSACRVTANLIRSCVEKAQRMKVVQTARITQEQYEGLFADAEWRRRLERGLLVVSRESLSNVLPIWRMRPQFASILPME